MDGRTDRQLQRGHARTQQRQRHTKRANESWLEVVARATVRMREGTFSEPFLIFFDCCC